MNESSENKREGRIEIDLGECVGCGMCARKCPHDAIRIEGLAAFVDHEECTVCGLCIDECPNWAIHRK